VLGFGLACWAPFRGPASLPGNGTTWVRPPRLQCAGFCGSSPGEFLRLPGHLTSARSGETIRSAEQPEQHLDEERPWRCISWVETPVTRVRPGCWEDGADLLVQGYVVEDEAILDELRLPAGETVVRVPWQLMKHLPPDVVKELLEEADGGTAGS
jgi:hypothetical protein